MTKKYKIAIAVLSILLAVATALSGWLYVFYESPEELAILYGILVSIA